MTSPVRDRSPLTRVAIGALLLAATSPRLIEAQDPVIKPTTTLSGTRLPVPQGITARQLADGRIELRWRAVAGATKYQVIRSVPPNPQAIVADADPTDTVFVDTDVRAGSTYYYVVSAYGPGDILGLKGGTLPVTATISATSTGSSGTGTTGGTTPVKITALTAIPDTLVLDAGAEMMRLFWPFSGTAPTYFLVERASGEKTAFELRYTTPVRSCCLGSMGDGISSVPVGTVLTYRVTPVDSATGVRGTPVLSAPVTVQRARVGTPAPDSTAPRARVTSLSVSTGAMTPRPCMIYLGVPSDLTGGRWMSTNEAVATVTDVPVVNCRSPGETWIVGSKFNYGELRIMAVRLTVTP